MKRKLLQLILAILLIFNTVSIGGFEIPYISNSASATVTSIIDDFSDSGASLSAMGWTTSAFSANESLTIENGTLKFVRGAAANSGASFSKALTGISNANRYVIEYRFKVDNPTVSEDRFNMLGGVATKRSDGTIDYGNIYSYADSTPEIIRHKTHKPGQGTADADYNYVGYGKLSDLAIDSGWTKIKYILDTTTGLYSLYVNDKYDTTAINLHFKGIDDVVNLHSLGFSSSTVAISTSATMYIDYLKAYAINNITPPTGREYLVYDTFDNLPDGYIPTQNEDGYTVNYSKLMTASNSNYPLYSGQSTTVQGGALRMTMVADPGAANRSSMNIQRYFDPAKAPATGYMTMEYDVNMEKHTFYPSAFPNLDGYNATNGSMSGVMATLFYQNQMQSKRYNGPTKTLIANSGNINATTGAFVSEANSNKWFTIKSVMNLDTKLYDTYVTDRATGAVVATVLGYQFNLIPGDTQILSKLFRIAFSITETGTQPDNSEQGIYWMDNLKLYYNTTGGGLDVSSVQPLNGSVRVANTTTPFVRFDRVLNPDTVTPDNIKVIKADGTPVTGYTTTLQSIAGVNKEVKITFGSTLDPLTTYYVVVGKGVKGVDGTFLADPATYSFTTADENIVFEDFTNVTVGTAVSALPNWTVTTVNDTDSTATVVNDNNLKAIKISKTKTTNASTITLTRANPFTAPGKYAVEFSTRVNNFKQVFDGFPSIGAQKSGTVITSDALKFGTGIAGRYYLNYENAGTDYADIIPSWGSYPTMWHTFKYVIDTNTDKFDLFLDGTLYKEDTTSALPLNMDFKNSGTRVDIDGLKDISFTIKTTDTAAAAAGTPSTPTSDFYIDNFAIYPVNNDLSVSAINVPQVVTNNLIDVVFSRDLVPSTLTQSMFSVKDSSNNPVSITGFALKTLGGQKRVAQLTTATLSKGTQYTVSVNAGAEDMTGAKMATAYSGTATTAGLIDNFNSTIDGQLPQGWTVDATNAGSGDEIAVYGGALKLNKSANTPLNSSISVNRVNTQSDNSKLAIGFKAKFESHGQGLEAFPAIKAQKGTNDQFNVVTASNDGSLYRTSYENGGNDRLNLISDITSDPYRWYDIKFVLDTQKDRYDVYIDGVNVPSWLKLPFTITSGTTPQDIDIVKDIQFKLKCTDTSGVDETVWIDDFSVLALTDDLTISSASIANERTGVSPTVGVWSATFNRAINPASVTNDNIVVTDNNQNPVSFYTTLDADGKTVSVHFNQELGTNTSYTVVVKDICDTSSTRMANNATYLFTTGTNKYLDENFNNVSVGTATGWNVNVANIEAGDSVDVQIDPLDANNRAIRLVKKDATLNSNISFNKSFVGAEKGSFSVTYRLMFEKHKQYITNGGSTGGFKYDTNGTTKIAKASVNLLSWLNTFKVKFDDLLPANNDTLDIISNIDTSLNKWYTIKYVVNTVTDKFTFYLDNGTGFVRKGAANMPFESAGLPVDIDGIDSFSFATATNSVGAGESIYWLDDIVVDRLPDTYVVAANPTPSATGISTMPTVYLDFNSALDPATIIKSNIQVLNGSDAIAQSDYNVELVSVLGVEKRVKVTFNQALATNTTYTVKVLSAVTSIGGNIAVPMSSDYTTTFTTVAPTFEVSNIRLETMMGDPITALSSVSGQTVYASTSIKNNSIVSDIGYTFIVVITDSQNKIVSITKQIKDRVISGTSDSIYMPLDIPSDVTNSYKIKAFYWETLQNVKPLSVVQMLYGNN